MVISRTQILYRLYYWIANIVFILHASLGLFFVTGWYFDNLLLFYYAAMTAWIGSWLLLGYCPLSRLEFTLRHQYDHSIDPATEIISHYIHKVFSIRTERKLIIRVGIICYICLMSLAVFT